MGKLIRRLTIGALVLSAACTTSQQTVPPLAGPSEFALSIRMVAIPDSLSQDGASQSAIEVQAFDANGKACANLPIRMDMGVGGTIQDFGTLSGRNIVTGSDGRAHAVYTAPPPPPPSAAGSGTVVTVLATPSTSVNCNQPGAPPVGNYDAANHQEVSIRLVPTGVIQPPAGTPTAMFTMSPSAALMNVGVTFDASASKPGTGASQISSYSWNFGDGTAPGTGRTISHTFATQQTFNVTLTVTNDRGISASTTVPTAVGAVTGPSPKFVFSPSAPAPGQTVVFNADQSTAAPGHTITSFNWNFGDGGTASGVTVSHAFSAAGTFNVVLSVLDDTQQKGSTSTAVTVASGGGGGGTTGSTAASFTVTPSSPIALQAAFFNASASTAATGHTLTNYAWDFGDGTVITGPNATVQHTFAAAGLSVVILTVTDDSGQKATTSVPVTIVAASTGSLTAEFSISPIDPTSGQLVTFNANLSTPLATIVSYDWDFGDGTIVNGVTSFITSHTYFTATGNIYTIRLTVHDNTGRTATNASHLLTVKIGTDPVARFTVLPSPAAVGATVTFDGSASTAFPGLPGPPPIPAKTIVLYQWDFGDGSPIVTTQAPTTTITHPYGASGSYTIRLTVIDSAGLSGATTRTLLVQ